MGYHFKNTLGFVLWALVRNFMGNLGRGTLHDHHRHPLRTAMLQGGTSVLFAPGKTRCPAIQITPCRECFLGPDRRLGNGACLSVRRHCQLHHTHRHSARDSMLQNYEACHFPLWRNGHSGSMNPQMFHPAQTPYGRDDAGWLPFMTPTARNYTKKSHRRWILLPFAVALPFPTRDNHVVLPVFNSAKGYFGST